MLAFRIFWCMSCVVSGTSKMTQTDILPQAQALHYHYICGTDSLLAQKSLTSGYRGIKLSVTVFRLLSL